MPRARQGTRARRIEVGGRTIEAPSDVTPILRREGVDTDRVQNLQQRITELESELNQTRGQLRQARSRATDAEQNVQNLQAQLEQAFTADQVRQVAQQAFDQGVQAVVQYLRNQGIL